MSRTFHHGERRRIRVKGIRRAQPDTRLMARALIEFARAEGLHEAEAAHRARRRQPDQSKDPKAKGDSASSKEGSA